MTFRGHTGTRSQVQIMVSPEKLVASEVHELLLEARPQADDENLARAAEITSSPDVITHDGFRADVFFAIQQLRKAISDGASASEAEDLLLDAISAGERWVRGYPQEQDNRKKTRRRARNVVSRRRLTLGP